mmetsp:Transcript_3014/g.8641  ORF Transcript_3014/g.8641 Transcript_3014/m.8641 type:complete len:203 (-) Transcript_3014:887-1495(-)
MPLQTAKEVIGACVTPAKYAHAAMAAMTGRWGPVSMMSVPRMAGWMRTSCMKAPKPVPMAMDGAKMPPGMPDQKESHVATALSRKKRREGWTPAARGPASSGNPSSSGTSTARACRKPLPHVSPPVQKPVAARARPHASEMAYGAKQPYASSSRLTCTPSSSPTAHRPPSRPDGMATSGTTHRISYSFRSSRSWSKPSKMTW